MRRFVGTSKGIYSKYKMDNLYLIGMMGSGKSVTGKKLAALLKWSFVDLDDVLQKEEKKTIAQIFESQGEDYFRNHETEMLNRISLGDRQVIATGGGIILREENNQQMLLTGTVIYLETSFEMLWQRVRGRDERPLLKTADPKGTLKGIFEKRKAIYERIAQKSVNTDDQTAEMVAEKIMAVLNCSGEKP